MPICDSSKYQDSPVELKATLCLSCPQIVDCLNRVFETPTNKTFTTSGEKYEN